MTNTVPAEQTGVNYKKTLNLPKTKFSMKANLVQNEPQILKKWTTDDLYAQIMQATDAGQKKFILNDGPPYANGDIHIGHALNKVLKDIIVKSKRLSGFSAPFVPGWDCHGLPIELQVEKKFGKVGTKLSAKAFRAECRKYATSQIKTQKKSFERLGILGDWKNPYITMDYKYEANEMRALAKIVENGYVTRGNKPVHWCLDCCSALAEAEVEYQDKSSPSIDVKYLVLESSAIPELQGSSVVIWTTTPWTLPASEAVTVCREFTYSLVEFKRETDAVVQRIIVAHELLSKIAHRYGIEVEQIKILQEFTGAQLSNVVLQHPFYADRKVPVIFGDHVTVEDGTGCVHTAPAHGMEDHQMGVKYKLPSINPVGPDGRYYDNVELFAGEQIWEANKKIIDLLNSTGHLLQHSKIKHSYPHCWRHKTPIIFRATPQWFISMDNAAGLRKKSVAAARDVQWLPQWGEQRFVTMVADRPDWCISRQRIWGVPIPFFIHKQTGDLHPRTVEIIEHVANAAEKTGIEAWHELDPATVLTPEELNNYVVGKDILDVWFDSGVEHYCVLNARPELQYPADLYLEGSDQHRGWFQSSLLTGVAITGQSPYKQVVTHGFTIDATGRKMSKSLGNIIDPEEVIQEFGADVLRLWVASTDYSREIVVAQENFQRVAETYRRIRNTVRYLLSNLDDFDIINNEIKFSDLLELDRWLLQRTMQIQTEIQQAYTDYNFHKIYHIVHNFCVVDLGNFYLDIIKDRQYTCAANSRARRSGQTAMWLLLESLVRWIAPILSFTAEEIWQYMPESGDREKSVFLAQWFAGIEKSKASNAAAAKINMDEWQKILVIRNEVNKALEFARQQEKIGSGLEAKVTVFCDAEHYALFSKLHEELRFIWITSSAEVRSFEEYAQCDKNSYIYAEESSNYKQLAVTVNTVEHAKCERCWHRRSDVGKNSEYPGLCQRCVINLTVPAGEERFYA